MKKNEKYSLSIALILKSYWKFIVSSFLTFVFLISDPVGQNMFQANHNDNRKICNVQSLRF